MTLATNETLNLLADIDNETSRIKQNLGGDPLAATDDWFAFNYIASARQRLSKIEDNHQRWLMMCEIARDWPRLRRAEQISDRLNLDREQFAFSKLKAAWKAGKISGHEASAMINSEETSPSPEL